MFNNIINIIIFIIINIINIINIIINNCLKINFIIEKKP